MTAYNLRHLLKKKGKRENGKKRGEEIYAGPLALVPIRLSSPDRPGRALSPGRRIIILLLFGHLDYYQKRRWSAPWLLLQPEVLATQPQALPQ